MPLQRLIAVVALTLFLFPALGAADAHGERVIFNDALAGFTTRPVPWDFTGLDFVLFNSRVGGAFGFVLPAGDALRVATVLEALVTFLPSPAAPGVYSILDVSLAVGPWLAMETVALVPLAGTVLTIVIAPGVGSRAFFDLQLGGRLHLPLAERRRSLVLEAAAVVPLGGTYAYLAVRAGVSFARPGARLWQWLRGGTAG